MRTKLATSAVLSVGAMLSVVIGGCIVSDQLTTVTIHSDGSADVAVYSSNIHSSDKGSKGDEELRQYADSFNAKKSADHERIAASGGKICESRWIRKGVPYSNLIVAKLPNAAALQEFCTIRTKDRQTVVEGRFARNGRHRRLTLAIALPKDATPPASEATNDTRENLANGLSETRIAVTDGTIVDSRGFVVARDKQSAILSPREIEKLLRTNEGKVDVFIEWEIEGK